MHRLPIRCIDTRWEVEVPLNHHNVWIRCDSQMDAYQMSLSGNLAFAALERLQSGEEVANELEEAARLFLKYGCTARAAWLHEHAKFARREPSVFDLRGT